MYEVVKPLEYRPKKNRRISLNKDPFEIGCRFTMKMLRERDYDIKSLLMKGIIREIPFVFPFEKEIVGRNPHSVYSRCRDCLEFSINHPLETGCQFCGSLYTVTYYDAENVQRFIDEFYTKKVKS